MNDDTNSLESPLVVVRGLRVVLDRDGGSDVVDEVGFNIGPGEVLGLVGESGCGKTTVGMSLLGHCRRGARVVAGEVVVDGLDIARLDERGLEAVRGTTVAYIPQDPPSALNPVLRVGRQLAEVLEKHRSEWDQSERDERLREVLAEVVLPSDRGFLRRYPHQLSGGQQQRLTIAMAVACRPRVIVCDEPTTGLDVTTQARVLQTLRELCGKHEIAALYISHDLAVVASIADRVAVMYAGRIVESGTREQLFRHPRHPYTRRLFLAAPDLDGRRVPVGIPGHAPSPRDRPRGCFFAARCTLAVTDCGTRFPPIAELEAGHSIRCYRAQDTDEALRTRTPSARDAVDAPAVLEVRGVNAAYGSRAVLSDVTLQLHVGETLALVGESGSGKTTLARCIAGLHEKYAGELLLAGQPLAQQTRNRSREQRQQIQYIFQSPYSSLNPRHTVGQSMGTPLRLFRGFRGGAASQAAGELLERVSLPRSVLNEFPDRLSGGERQRVAIARALAARPSVLICDEVTSALDVSVQAAIVDLLAQLRVDMELSLLFITHNLALIRTVADRVAVMHDGAIVEEGQTGDIFGAPADAYTRALLANTPGVDMTV